MPTALIIGASRGIGHELVRQYRADGWRVIATARKPHDCDALRRLGAEAPPARRHQCRIGRPAWAGNWTTKRSTPPGWWPACTARATTASRPSRNSTRSCTPTCWRRCACCRSSRRWWRNARGKLAVISSRMGSIGERSSDQRLAVPRQQGRAEFRAGRRRADLRPAGRHLRRLPPGLGADRHGRRRRHADRAGKRAPTCARTLAGADAGAERRFLNHDGSTDRLVSRTTITTRDT